MKIDFFVRAVREPEKIMKIKEKGQRYISRTYAGPATQGHDNVIEACLCVAVPVAMLRNNFLPRTAKHQLT
jgi:hypothetical protein